MTGFRINFCVFGFVFLQLTGALQGQDEMSERRRSHFDKCGYVRLDNSQEPRISTLKFSKNSEVFAYNAADSLIVVRVRDFAVISKRKFPSSEFVFVSNKEIGIVSTDKQEAGVRIWDFTNDSMLFFNNPRLHVTREEIRNDSFPQVGLADARSTIGRYIFIGTKSGLERFEWKRGKFEVVFSWEIFRNPFLKLARTVPELHGYIDRWSTSAWHIGKLPAVIFANDECIAFREKKFINSVVQKKDDGTWAVHYVMRHILDVKKNQFFVDNGNGSVSQLSLKELLFKQNFPPNYPYFGWYGTQNVSTIYQYPSWPVVLLHEKKLVVDEFYEQDLKIGFSGDIRKSQIRCHTFQGTLVASASKKTKDTAFGEFPTGLSPCTCMTLSPDEKYVFIQFYRTGGSRSPAVIVDSEKIMEVL